MCTDWVHKAVLYAGGSGSYIKVGEVGSRRIECDAELYSVTK